jgi:DNA-binding CsgD family transcriptional regulator
MIHDAALDFVDTIERQETIGCVLDAMQKVLGRIGIDLLCLHACSASARNFDELLLASRLPAGWLELYVRKQYFPHDPSQRHVKRTVHPYEWKDAPYDPEREPKSLELVQRARDFNIDNGLVIPVPSPHGCMGQVWMSGYNMRLEKRDKPSLQLMGLYAFDRVQRLSGWVMPKVTLSAREREVLTWTALGKTAWEIGEILNISQRTVEWHLQSMVEKLGTCNRVQTVVVALREQLISI